VTETRNIYREKKTPTQRPKEIHTYTQTKGIPNT